MEAGRGVVGGEGGLESRLGLREWWDWPCQCRLDLNP